MLGECFATLSEVVRSDLLEKTTSKQELERMGRGLGWGVGRASGMAVPGRRNSSFQRPSDKGISGCFQEQQEISVLCAYHMTAVCVYVSARARVHTCAHSHTLTNNIKKTGNVWNFDLKDLFLPLTGSISWGELLSQPELLFPPPETE